MNIKKGTQLKVTSQSSSTNCKINISDKMLSAKGSENYGLLYYEIVYKLVKETLISFTMCLSTLQDKSNIQGLIVLKCFYKKEVMKSRNLYAGSQIYH